MNTFLRHTTRRMRHPLATVILILLTVTFLLIAGGCNGNPTNAPDPIFSMELPLPTGTSTAAELTLEPGTTYDLPVSFIATLDQTLNIHLMMDKEDDFPEAIKITLEDEDIVLSEGDHITVTIKYNTDESVPPGLYHTYLTATIPESVNGVSGIAKAIDIIIPGVSGTPEPGE